MGKLEEIERSSSRTCRWSRWGWGGLCRPAPGRRRPAAALCRGGATPARGRRRGVVGELHRDMRELLVGSIEDGERRRRGFRRSMAAAATLLRGGGTPAGLRMGRAA